MKAIREEPVWAIRSFRVSICEDVFTPSRGRSASPASQCIEKGSDYEATDAPKSSFSTRLLPSAKIDARPALVLRCDGGTLDAGASETALFRGGDVGRRTGSVARCVDGVPVRLVLPEAQGCERNLREGAVDLLEEVRTAREGFGDEGEVRHEPHEGLSPWHQTHLGLVRLEDAEACCQGEPSDNGRPGRVCAAERASHEVQGARPLRIGGKDEGQIVA